MLAAALVAHRAYGATSTWVWRGTDGGLAYRQQDDGDRIPDFSMVGYGAGWTDLPATPPVVVTVTATTGDATARIQTAINSVAALPLQANGYRGTVQLAPGDYTVTVAANATPEEATKMGFKVGREGIMPLLSPPKYDDVTTSPLKATVKPGAHEIDLVLEPQPAGIRP
jgi:hypothetical protein